MPQCQHDLGRSMLNATLLLVKWDCALIE